MIEMIDHNFFWIVMIVIVLCASMTDIYQSRTSSNELKKATDKIQGDIEQIKESLLRRSE